jgi:hypothetical protein
MERVSKMRQLFEGVDEREMKWKGFLVWMRENGKGFS